MESTHVIAIANGEDIKKEKTIQFPLQPIVSCIGKNGTHCSIYNVPITMSYLTDKKQMKNDYDIRKMIHSTKVGISLVLVSLLYILNPLFKQVGENAMWAIITVVVIFEFSAGATLGKGFNRGIGTIVGGGLGCLAAIFAQSIGGVGNSIIIATLVYIFGSAGTYFRLVPTIKNKYDYGVVVFMLTFNLVVVSGARHGVKVWEIALERLLTILIGFVVCICVSLLVFPCWASDELHESIVSRFHDLAITIQEECSKPVHEKNETNEPAANITVCKSVLFNSKSKDESLAKYAKWEPWHGKFGYSYPWKNYLKVGEVLREVAPFVAAMQKSKKWGLELEECEAIGSMLAWTIREVGDSMKQMRKCDVGSILVKLKSTKEELCLVICRCLKAEVENGEMVSIASFVFLLLKVVEKVEELVNEVGELGDIAAFCTHQTPHSS